MTMRIEADIDKYGSLVRSSYLADFMELLAVNNVACTFSQLDDIVENKWSRKGNLIVLEDEDLDDIESTSEGAILCLEERIDILGNMYPFYIDQSRIHLKPGVSLVEHPYITLLALTSIHAYKIPTDQDIEFIFEDIVVRALRNAGLRAANVGDISRRNGMRFPDTMNELSTEIGIVLNPRAVPHRVRANDAGIDVLALLDLRDSRAGRWSLIGQLTVGSSDSWSSKIAEPRTVVWQKFMNEHAAPHVFLAVPHHVDRRAFADIGTTGHSVVDRLRIVRFLSIGEYQNARLVEAIADTEFEDIQF